jgi:hypothetical protein
MNLDDYLEGIPSLLLPFKLCKGGSQGVISGLLAPSGERAGLESPSAFYTWELNARQQVSNQAGIQENFKLKVQETATLPMAGAEVK